MAHMRSDAEHGRYFKVIEIPFSPFQNEFGDEDDDDEEPARRRGSVGYGSRRQEYLRSYTFCRPSHVATPTVQERVRTRFQRLWAAVACNPYNLPRRVRRLKDKLALRSARQSLQRSRNGGSSRMPFLQPCFRA